MQCQQQQKGTTMTINITDTFGEPILAKDVEPSKRTRAHIDTAFEADLAAIESNIASIFRAMSTDPERLDAIEAVTAAWTAADAELKAAITSLVNATKAGAGLEADEDRRLPALSGLSPPPRHHRACARAAAGWRCDRHPSAAARHPGSSR